MISISGQFTPLVLELLALERQIFSPWTCIRENVMNTTAPLFFILSSSNVQITRRNIKVQMSLNSGHIRPLTSELLALEHRKNIVDTIAPSGFIGSYSNLQTTRTGITSWTSSFSGQSRLFASELHALERKKFSHRLIMEKTWTRYNDFIFYWIIIKLKVTR